MDLRATKLGLGGRKFFSKYTMPNQSFAAVLHCSDNQQLAQQKQQQLFFIKQYASGYQ
jgi:hypothetical protein